MPGHQIYLDFGVRTSPLIRSFKPSCELEGFRCLCYRPELVSPARHRCCRLELASLAPLSLSPSAHVRIYAGHAAISRWTVRTLLLPLCEVVRKRRINPRSTTTPCTTFRVKISARVHLASNTNSQRDSLLRNSWNNLLPFFC
jgi:hypothetical protein